MNLEGLAALSIFCLIISIGFLLNGFIVVTNLIWCIKYRIIETIDLLITSLGLLGLIHLTIHMEYIGFLISDWSLFRIEDPEFIDTATLCIMFCSLWWGSVLCVFYCVKITNYSNRIFIRIKMNISKMVPWMLLISLIISCLLAFPYHWSLRSIHLVNATSDGNRTTEVNEVNLFIITFAGSIVPFMICCVAIYLIIVSLLRHTRNMSARGSSFSDAQQDIHIRVIWSMITFLLLYILYFVAHISTSLLLDIQFSGFYLLCHFFIFIYPSLHSIYFIISNTKLKSSFLLVLHFTWVEKLTHQDS